MKGVVGPLFFEEQEKTVTINTDRYLKILEVFWKELEENYRGYLPKFWLQQDGATPHTYNKSLDWIKNHFGSRVISRRCDHEWAPYSPDLSPPDYYLWGFLKDRVYATKPRTLGELKKKIQEEMRSISRTTCKSVMQNFVLRLEKCANLNGCHLEHVL
ncbi:hypothetical protein LOD99_9147 [Oopsacas minuta]|uniref:Transposase n=1 Tax=Oopsacas minuta TaxID=111878 RepID=A0AAV7JDM7_9METZ|nr:hypothetical protein LOD99_9147 [Oopsacas minuta]